MLAEPEDVTNRPTGRFKRCYRFRGRSVKAGPLDNEQEENKESSKLEVRSGARWMRTTPGSGCWQQAFFESVQAFPGGLRQGRVRSHNVADHLPGCEVERALRRGTHGQRH